MKVRFYQPGDEQIYLTAVRPLYTSCVEPPGYYYPAADYEALEAKLARMVEAAKEVSITATYLVLDLKGHGFKLAEKLEAEVSQLKAAIAAAKEKIV